MQITHIVYIWLVSFIVLKTKQLTYNHRRSDRERPQIIMSGCSLRETQLIGRLLLKAQSRPQVESVHRIHDGKIIGSLYRSTENLAPSAILITSQVMLKVEYYRDILVGASQTSLFSFDIVQRRLRFLLSDVISIESVYTNYILQFHQL